jgi:Phytanoyl-CoA dioxygenase (PhyH)
MRGRNLIRWLRRLRHLGRSEPPQPETTFGDDLRYFAASKDLAALLGQAESPDFWRGLCPELTVSSEPFAAPLPSLPLARDASSRLVAQIVEEGYFQTAPLVPTEEIRRLAAAVSAVVAAGFHPLFATVYDEAWRLLAGLGDVLAPILGPGFQVVPDFWLWHVDAGSERSGWAPHRDAQFANTLRADGRPTLVTVWIPFTDATPLNSCIYVLPLPRDPSYPTKTRAQGIEQFQDIRALPAAAGSILGWNQNILHWGSRGSRYAEQPRISWGIYFQSGDVPRFDPSARELRGPLSFATRLSYIGAALARYDRLFPLPPALKAFAASTRRAP